MLLDTRKTLENVVFLVRLTYKIALENEAQWTEKNNAGAFLVRSLPNESFKIASLTHNIY